MDTDTEGTDFASWGGANALLRRTDAPRFGEVPLAGWLSPAGMNHSEGWALACMWGPQRRGGDAG